MQPPKRQIIKTRPQRPYIIARIILVLIAVTALVLLGLLLLHPHPAHAALQEAVLAGRKTAIQAFPELCAHEVLS